MTWKLLSTRQRDAQGFQALSTLRNIAKELMAKGNLRKEASLRQPLTSPRGIHTAVQAALPRAAHSLPA